MTNYAANYADFHRRSIDDRDAFWAEQAQLIDWHKPFDQRLRLQTSRRSPSGSSAARPTCATTPSTGTSRTAPTRTR